MKKLIFTLFCLAITMQFSFAQSHVPYTNFDNSSDKDSILVNSGIDSVALASYCSDPNTFYPYSNYYINGGYASGTNANQDSEKLEKYLFSAKSIVSHVIAFFYYVNASSQGDSVNAVLRSNNGTLMARSAPVSLASVGTHALFNPADNTSSDSLGVNVFSFGGGIPIYSADSLMVGITIPTGAGDSIAVASTLDGCASTSQAWEKRSDGSLHPLGDAWGINVNLFIFPIYEINDQLTSAGVTLNGLTINAAYPNPTNNSVNLNYAIDKSSNVRIEIYNTVGQQVMSKSLGNQTPGKYTQNMDMSKLAKGTYFYSIVTDNAKLFGQVAVQ